MKPKKQVWIAVLCLLSAIAIAIAFSVHTSKVQTAKRAAPPNRGAIAQPAVYLAHPSLRAAIPNATLWDTRTQRMGTGLQNNATPFLPPVEEFTLTPPNPERGITKTTIAVRFAGQAAEKLPAQFPITLIKQHVVMVRSAGDASTFVTSADFDWQAFARQQALRQQAASQGKMVPVFEGRRFIRMEKMQFLDPAQILGTLQSHQPIQFSPGILNDGTVTVVPDHELMINAIPVVEDPSNTFDPCVNTAQNLNGAWTFNTLMQGIACSGGNCTVGTQQGRQMAENMLMDMFLAWQNTNLQINHFLVPNREGIGTLGGSSGLLANWPIDSQNTCSNGPNGACPALLNAPVHLNAIVNRIDLGENNAGLATAGELRFIFGVTAGTSANTGLCPGGGGQRFNIILEYNVPSNISAPQWANAWNSLPTSDFGQDYLGPLKTTITDAVVLPNKCTDGGGNSVSCLAQIRTNEIELSPSQGPNGPIGLWEMRQFILVQNNGPQLQETTVSMTPDSSFNFGSPKCGTSNLPACNFTNTLQTWINDNQSQILASGGALPAVPDSFNGGPFLGGSSFNSGPGSFWVDQQQTNSEPARVDFSANTCSACHGGETWVADFQQVVNRSATGHNDAASGLSNFLLGCTDSSDGLAGCTATQCGINTPCTETVPDPNTCVPSPQFNCKTPFGDLLRRMNYLSALLGGGSGGGGTLMEFVKQPIGIH